MKCMMYDTCFLAFIKQIPTEAIYGYVLHIKISISGLCAAEPPFFFFFFGISLNSKTLVHFPTDLPSNTE